MSDFLKLSVTALMWRANGRRLLGLPEPSNTPDRFLRVLSFLFCPSRQCLFRGCAGGGKGSVGERPRRKNARIDILAASYQGLLTQRIIKSLFFRNNLMRL